MYLTTGVRVVRVETTHYHLIYLYEFFCRGCRELSQLPVKEELVKTLMANGVEMVVRCGCDEIAEIWAREHLPGLTEDDLTEGMISLARLVSVPVGLDVVQKVVHGPSHDH